MYALVIRMKWSDDENVFVCLDSQQFDVSKVCKKCILTK